MSFALLFLAGALVGAAAAWLVASRRLGRPGAKAQPVLEIPDDLELPSETAMHIASGLEAETTFEPVAYVLVEKCAARIQMPCLIAMRETQGGAAVITNVSAALDRRLVGQEVDLLSEAGRAFTDGVPVVAPSEQRLLNVATKDRRRGVGGGIAVPLSQGGSVYGAVIAVGEATLGVDETIGGMTELARKFQPVLIPAHIAMVAMRRSQTDELTGLQNRRALSSAMNGNARDRVALIVLDIDHFKQVNDTLGHEAGDVGLKHVARIVREHVRLRDGDVAARIGGEEFAVWLPGASLEIAQEIAERMRAQVQTSPFRYGGQEHRLTISIGVTAFPYPIPAIQNLMNVADAALYTAKRGGRNKVVAGRSSHIAMQPPDAGR